MLLHVLEYVWILSMNLCFRKVRSCVIWSEIKQHPPCSVPASYDSALLSERPVFHLILLLSRKRNAVSFVAFYYISVPLPHCLYRLVLCVFSLFVHCTLPSQSEVKVKTRHCKHVSAYLHCGFHFCWVSFLSYFHNVRSVFMSVLPNMFWAPVNYSSSLCLRHMDLLEQLNHFVVSRARP
jgi:hypothetical protein